MRFNGISQNPFIYDVVQKVCAWGNERIVDLLSSKINPQNNETVLDVGCGTGKFARVFADSYTGIDTDDGYIDLARKKYGNKFFKMDATKLTFPDDYFNYVFSVNVFHHLDDMQVAMVAAEMKRVCKSGGQIFVIDPVWPNRLNFIGTLFFALDFGKHQRRLAELRDLLQVHGFKILTPRIKGGFPYQYAVFSFKK